MQGGVPGLPVPIVFRDKSEFSDVKSYVFEISVTSPFFFLTQQDQKKKKIETTCRFDLASRLIPVNVSFLHLIFFSYKMRILQRDLQGHRDFKNP